MRALEERVKLLENKVVKFLKTSIKFSLAVRKLRE